jgi:hypothetical protein
MNLGALEQKIFATEMKILHDQVRRQIQDSNQKYNDRVDQKRREVQFEVGDEVLAHLRKERFPRGTYNMLNMKKIGPCKILRKFTANSYEIELLDNVGISPIFSVVDLYPCNRDDTGELDDQEEIQWEKKMPIVQKTSNGENFRTESWKENQKKDVSRIFNMMQEHHCQIKESEDVEAN